MSITPGNEYDGKRAAMQASWEGPPSPNGANNNDDDQNDNQRGANETEEFADLCPAKVSLFPPEESIVAWGVDIVHPEVHVVGVMRLLALGIPEYLHHIT